MSMYQMHLNIYQMYCHTYRNFDAPRESLRDVQRDQYIHGQTGSTLLCRVKGAGFGVQIERWGPGVENHFQKI